MGKRITYECGIVGFDADVEDIVFIFEVAAFQTKWTVIRSYRSILDFHEKVRLLAPRNSNLVTMFYSFILSWYPGIRK